MLADISVLVGRGRQGKSTLARSWLTGARRVIVLDVKEEPDHARGRHIANTCGELVELTQSRTFNVAFRGFRYVADRTPVFEFVNELALHAKDCVLLWEECDQLMPRGKLPPIAYQLVNSGRHEGVKIIACARRVIRVPRDLTASATRITCFQTAEPRDVRYLEEFIGEGARQVRELPEYHALDWQEREGAHVRRSLFM